MFSVVHGGAWFGHLHHLAPHQLCSPNQPTTRTCARKRCKTMVQRCQYQLELEFRSNGCPHTSHSHCTVCVQFVMLTEEWNDGCFLYRYRLTIFEPLLHLLSHLDHVFFVNAKEDYWFHFFLSYFQHHTTVQNLVVEWSLQALFCSMAFHHTTNSITQWFHVARCKENPFCFDGKVLFMGT